ncbi:MAG TPA: hypothetical protein VMV56_08810 [Williamwhitmania sp.]|nr:hypothetical protein [Williamwhitmania sp.]
MDIEEIQANRAVDLLAENKRLKNIIIEAKICAAALCIAEIPSLKGLKEIASILNQGINEGDVKKALLGDDETGINPYLLTGEELKRTESARKQK